MKRYIILMLGLCSTIILAGCGSELSTDSDQTIVFSSYTMAINTGYQMVNKENLIDKRIVGKVISVYQKQISTLGSEFQDNIIISEDKLSPRASLEDYVQAGIGGISYTWGKYESLSFEKGSLGCAQDTLPTITNSFSIRRTPPNQSEETLYFVQHFIHDNDKIITISMSSLSKDTLDSLHSILQTITCK